MKYSDYPVLTQREAPKDEEAVNARLLLRGGFVDKVMAGVYTFLPLGLRVFKKIEGLIRKEMEDLGGQELLMPSLHPRANWEKSGRIDTYDSLFKFTSFYSKIDYVLGPTHEEIITPIGKKYIQSYKDLPLYLFQIQNKFRDEKRAKSGLLRGREFFMKDLYSFHASESDLDVYYEKVKKKYQTIFKAVGIGARTHLTFASGGTFAKYSHEFQTITPAGEDTIHICQACRVAINNEIINEQSVCPECSGDKFVSEKAIEVGNIFKLKTKFSKPFECFYKDELGKIHEVIMGCYGIGINRLMGTVVEVHHDDAGIIWPESIAPFRVYLADLGKGMLPRAKKIYANLQAMGIEVLWDNREGVHAGEKLRDADLLGIPFRAVIGAKTGKKVELKRRNAKTIKLVDEKSIAKIVGKG